MPPEKSKMDETDLLSIVQPSGGWFAVLGIKHEKDVKQRLVATRKEVDALAIEFVKEKRNVFFGLAKYITGENRKQDNVRALKSFWLDIDCGPAKAAVNKETGKPFGYIDQAAGGQALKNFCELIGLPKPIIVNSGRGLHVYWALTEEVPPEQWQPVANRLRQLCAIHDLYVDGSVFETARILRIPGTYNFKDDPPNKVAVVHGGAARVDYKELCSLLRVEVTSTPEPKVARELSPLEQMQFDNVEASFHKIMVRSAEGSGCQQLLHCYTERATLPEPMWFSALSVAKFCVDGEKAIHKLSKDHTGYVFEEAQKKANGAKGPHGCDVFEAKNPGGCDGCSHKGKLTSPIQLGNTIAEYDGSTIFSDAIPTYPDPYFRGQHGGVYKQSRGEEDKPKFVYEHDLYVVDRMVDPNLGHVVVMKLHLPKDGVSEFVIPNTKVTDRGELRRELAKYGVVAPESRLTMILDYLMLSVRELQHQKKADEMKVQFGWADNDSKFIVGDREITADGVFHSPLSSVTEDIAAYMDKKGTLEKWKEVFALYGRPGLELQAFGALSAFGAPLLKFTGQKGTIINMVHNTAGTGKTTILRMCNSVFGDPEGLLGTPDDTYTGRVIKLGILNNIANTIDEMTNTEDRDFSKAAYAFSQGRGKDKAKANANELRPNKTTWRTITLTSSNASFSEKLTSLKHNPDGEMMRLIELRIPHTDEDIISTQEGKDLFDHQLNNNFGQAGEAYMQWVVPNLEEVKNNLLKIQKKVDGELRFTSRERNWSAVMAANFTGGLIARQLGLIDWDMKPIYKKVTAYIADLKRETIMPTSNIASVLGDFILRHSINMLVVDDGADQRTHRPKFPVLEPKGDLIIRYEPDTRLMYVLANRFKRDCVESQIDYKDTLRALERKGIFKGTVTKRMSKGMKIVSSGVHALVFDCNNSDFFDVDKFVDSQLDIKDTEE